MRWFKHFTDNHRGRSIQNLMDKHGHAGPNCYWILVEMCAEKLEKKFSSKLEQTDSEFSFNRKLIENAFRMKRESTKNVLVSIQESNLLSFNIVDNEIIIKMPILLELLDYDSKRPRSRPSTARKKSVPELEPDKDIEPDKEPEPYLCSESDPPAGKVPLADKPPKTKLSKSDSDLNKKIWDSYFDAYVRRHGAEPPRNATINGQISKLRQRLGVDAIHVVAFYLTSNNSFYLQRLHPVGLCLQDAESLHVQWQRGRAITTTMVRNFEKQTQAQEREEQIKNLWKDEK